MMLFLTWLAAVTPFALLARNFAVSPVKDGALLTTDERLHAALAVLIIIGMLIYVTLLWVNNKGIFHE